MQVAGALYFVIMMIRWRTPLGVKYDGSMLFAQCGLSSCSYLSSECDAFWLGSFSICTVELLI